MYVSWRTFDQSISVSVWHLPKLTLKILAIYFTKEVLGCLIPEKTILKSERSASINELNADYSKSHTAFRLCLRKWLIACISALHYLCVYLVTMSYTESLIRANEPSSYCDKACGMSSSPKSCSALLLFLRFRSKFRRLPPLWKVM